ncbi:cytochrome b [Trinickia mobilis]|uniref:cytochrome b n=1 Tax=Trinickia mobilis TaxID=2816356 RepID=UPI001A907999|nr:cytochrome b [Trinickia mobilis]
MERTQDLYYSGVAIGLHWLIALLIGGGFYLGWIMTDIPGFTPRKLEYFSWHKWIGVTVFVLVMVRVTWRVTHRAPALSHGIAGWQRGAAHLAHFLLYTLMVLIPISGYFYSSAAGVQVVYLGLVPLPPLIDPNDAIKGTLRLIHMALTYTLLALVTLHVLAVLKHQFFDRDDTLARMMPFLRRNRKTQEPAYGSRKS